MSCILIEERYYLKSFIVIFFSFGDINNGVSFSRKYNSGYKDWILAVTLKICPVRFCKLSIDFISFYLNET
ncbi:hypothetical protein GCM10007332_26540 [Epilithonimonas arachidiradicis]|uniref:Uncharacterized protein n=1 Tax=Epilithonimonas arachidiradicis TaxID=1617282 RepID=A0ABQ1X6Z3_9FLAO|nr:hypothetical protein GCM10007332_26540 [Epilithonimonas arachidiradicis]